MNTRTTRCGACTVPPGPGTGPGLIVVRRNVPSSSVGTRPNPVKPGVSGFSWKTTEQGAATSVLVATSPRLDGIGGRYFEDCNQADPADDSQDGRHGVAAYALDPQNADRLWEVSAETLA